MQLAQIFDALDPATRRAFQVWQQQLAVAVKGNAQNLNNVLGNLPAFSADATDVLKVLDVEHTAVTRLVRNGGTVFSAVTQNQSALRNLITSAGATFATTAANNDQLAATVQQLPEFLRQTRATLGQVQSFSLDADPVVRELIPVADQLGPDAALGRRVWHPAWSACSSTSGR